jgi:arginyl-tRNA synthetase
MQELKQAVKDAAKKLFDTDLEPEISRPDEKFGDYATNAALQLAKKAAATPRQIAEKLAAELEGTAGIKDISIAGPGFINFRLTDEALRKAASAATDLPKPLDGQEILVEFGDPNPFKEMHIGHLYSYVVGDAIASLLEAAGAVVKRLSYHGDVGRQVAQAVWGMRQTEVTDDAGLGQAYAKGAQAYEDNNQAKAEIDEINRHVYEQDDPQINALHQKGVKISFEHFDKILNMLSISTDKRYFESQVTPTGVELVEENTGKVFIKSDGAVIFKGEKAGLHTRVFITSKGLPTYETKDLGNAVLKDRDFPQASQSLIITASEQAEYFKVMLAALAQIKPELAEKTRHLSHGFVNLSTGKMSSRTGDVYAAESLITDVKKAAEQQFPDSKQQAGTAIAALKYDFLKSRLGGDITFDVQESVSLEGNSGPYLQYAHARACSILAKSGDTKSELTDEEFDENERSLALKISEYPEAVQKAAAELMPHHICTYLYELAQAFNRFYETSRIIGDEREVPRLRLVKSYSQVLKSGLTILNIEAPERM